MSKPKARLSDAELERKFWRPPYEVSLCHGRKDGNGPWCWEATIYKDDSSFYGEGRTRAAAIRTVMKQAGLDGTKR